MTQKIWALGGSGIVAVLIIAGIFLFAFGANSSECDEGEGGIERNKNH